MLKIQKLDKNAMTPTCTYPGYDLGYDLYSVSDVELLPYKLTRVHTGIAAFFEVEVSLRGENYCPTNFPYGLLLRDRSSLAINGIMVSAGVVDAGYRGELVVMMTNVSDTPYFIKKFDRIAQAIPLPVLTGSGVKVVDELPDSKRGTAGFGSSGA